MFVVRRVKTQLCQQPRVRGGFVIRPTGCAMKVERRVSARGCGASSVVVTVFGSLPCAALYNVYIYTHLASGNSLFTSRKKLRKFLKARVRNVQ